MCMALLKPHCYSELLFFHIQVLRTGAVCKVLALSHGVQVKGLTADVCCIAEDSLQHVAVSLLMYMALLMTHCYSTLLFFTSRCWERAGFWEQVLTLICQVQVKSFVGDVHGCA